MAQSVNRLQSTNLYPLKKLLLFFGMCVRSQKAVIKSNQERLLISTLSIKLDNIFNLLRILKNH